MGGYCTTRRVHLQRWSCTSTEDANNQAELLQVRNKGGETSVFRATRYGKKIIFDFLAQEVDKFCKSPLEFNHFFVRDDKTTILHMAILTGNFDTALTIASKYPFLCHLQAQNKWTALQILACSPAAFKSGARFGLVKNLLYKSVLVDEEGNMEEVGLIKKAFNFIISICKTCCILPMIDEVRKMKKSHKDALELSKILIQFDTSWMDTHEPSAEVTPEIMGITPIPISDDHRHENYDIERGESGISDSDEAPLLLAARNGCIEIVKEILKKFPPAVYYLNHNQENLLHVAIKSRNMEIFNFVEDGISSLRGLIGAVDNKKNSILNMVGCPRKVHPGTKMKSPVLQLSDDLLLLERLEKKCPSYLINHRNDEMMTATELFAKNNETLRTEAKEWLKKTAEHSTVVIILIATVAFAAAYTVPGGPDQQTGYPLLLRLPFFLVFTVTDVLSLGFALTAVVVFLSIITSSYQLKDFRRSLPHKLFLGFTLLFLSVTMMMVAFAATIILMVNKKARWTKIALHVVAFFPICIFMLSYIPLYIKLAEALRDGIKKICKTLPYPSCLHQEKKKTLPRLASHTSRPASSHSSSKSV